MWFGCKNRYLINNFNFSILPAWWTKNYDMHFGEQYIFDPDYRNGLYEKMKLAAKERFAALNPEIAYVGNGISHPEFANATPCALFGAQVNYPEDNFPWGHHLPEDTPYDSLTLPDDIAKTFPYSEVIEQYAYQNRKNGTEEKPTIPVRGFLNDAFLLFGERIFLDCLSDPEEAEKVFDTLLALTKKVFEYTYGHLKHRHMILVTNCTVAMISPQLYDDMLFAYDKEISRLATEVYDCTFGVHHCGLIDRYIESYQKLPNVSFVEAGWGSDVKAVLQAFPGANVNYLLSTPFLNEATVAQAREMAENLLKAADGNLSRFSVSAADLDNGPWLDKLCAVEEVFRA